MPDEGSESRLVSVDANRAALCFSCDGPERITLDQQVLLHFEIDEKAG